MTTVLTICSANYLAHARTLGASLLKHNPDIEFVIGLVDRLPAQMDVAEWRPMQIILVEELALPQFAEMEQKYSIVELNTAVKPFYMEHLYRRNPAVDAVIYLDPDIAVYGSLKPLLEKLRNFNMVVTPHNVTYDDSKMNVHFEIAMLCTGVYNLGFIATRRTDTTFAFLKWWQHRLVDHCYQRPGTGLFTDQIWVTLAPLYFPGIYVEMDPGYNMSYWNHFERRLSQRGEGYSVNGQHDLVFYHFSNYNPLNPEAIANRVTEPTLSFAERPDLRKIYGDYAGWLLEAGYSSFKPFKCAFGRKPAAAPPPPERTLKRSMQNGLKKFLRAVPSAMRRPLGRVSRFVADNC